MKLILPYLLLVSTTGVAVPVIEPVEAPRVMVGVDRENMILLLDELTRLRSENEEMERKMNEVIKKWQVGSNCT